jgi:hypothetical protein
MHALAAALGGTGVRTERERARALDVLAKGVVAYHDALHGLHGQVHTHAHVQHTVQTRSTRRSAAAAQQAKSAFGLLGTMWRCDDWRSRMPRKMFGIEKMHPIARNVVQKTQDKEAMLQMMLAEDETFAAVTEMLFIFDASSLRSPQPNTAMTQCDSFYAIESDCSSTSSPIRRSLRNSISQCNCSCFILKTWQYKSQAWDYFAIMPYRAWGAAGCECFP